MTAASGTRVSGASGALLPVTRCRRGVAMVLVMIAVTVALILSTSFLAAQSTATGMARNVDRRARARALAESGLAMTLAHVERNRGWRSRMREGTWIADHPFAGGSFTVIGEDGTDVDGDGLVDGDGDLTDDESEPVTLTAIGSFGGVTHAVRAVVRAKLPRKHMLMIVPNPAHLNVNDQRRRTQFDLWGFDVSLIDERTRRAAFDAAVVGSDVVYIPESAYSGNVRTKVRGAPIGVVVEENFLNDEMGLATIGGSSYSPATRIDVVDDAHLITEPLGTGRHAIVDRSARLRYVAGALAPDASVLAERLWFGRPVLAVLEAGDRLVGGGPAAGRRVMLPVGGTGFGWASLTSEGRTLVERALRWAAEPIEEGQVAWWALDEAAGRKAFDGAGGLDGTYERGVTLGVTSPFFLTSFAGFDGSNDHVAVPHDDAFLLDEGTVMLWFRTDRPWWQQGLISKDSWGRDTGGHLSIFTSGRRVFALLQGVRSSRYLWSTPIEADTWYHLALSFGPAGMKLYVDGALVGSNDYTGGMGATSGGSGNYEPMALGALTSRSGNRTLTGMHAYFSGNLNDVRFFDRALTEAEIGRLAGGLTYAVRWDEQP